MFSYVVNSHKIFISKLVCSGPLLWNVEYFNCDREVKRERALVAPQLSEFRRTCRITRGVLRTTYLSSDQWQMEEVYFALVLLNLWNARTWEVVLGLHSVALQYTPHPSYVFWLV